MWDAASPSRCRCRVPPLGRRPIVVLTRRHPGELPSGTSGPRWGSRDARKGRRVSHKRRGNPVRQCVMGRLSPWTAPSGAPVGQRRHINRLDGLFSHRQSGASLGETFRDTLRPRRARRQRNARARLPRECGRRLGARRRRRCTRSRVIAPALPRPPNRPASAGTCAEDVPTERRAASVRRAGLTVQRSSER